jgi:hypothetical protein
MSPLPGSRVRKDHSLISPKPVSGPRVSAEGLTDYLRIADHPGAITERTERDTRPRPFPPVLFSFLYLALVNNPVDCAIEGSSEKNHKCGPNRECAELEYIHRAWSRSLT